MLWFLRMIPSYTAMEQRSKCLEEQLSALNSELHGVRAELAECLRRTTDAYAYQATGRRVFMQASNENVPAQPSTRVVGGRRLGRQVVEDMTREFAEAFVQNAGRSVVHDDLRDLAKEAGLEPDTAA